MEEKNVYIRIEESLKSPYWWVEYIDDYGYRHLAKIKDKKNLKFLQSNYSVINIMIIND